MRTYLFAPARLRFLFVALVIGGLALLGSRPVQAEIFYSLLNHPGGNQSSSGGYGLRVDNAGGVHTFNFESGLSNVTFNFADGSNEATIIGVVQHNQGSGHYWQISATLREHSFTNDNPADPWNGTNSTLYDDMFADMKTNGANENHAGENNLKMASYGADRIGFEFVQMTMTHLGDATGSGAVDFTLGSQTNGSITLYDYPDNNSAIIPFFITKGHRLGNSSNELAGAGWLNEDETDQTRLYTQDFLFMVGDRSQFSGVPEPTSLIMFGSAVLFFARRRRR